MESIVGFCVENPEVVFALGSATFALLNTLVKQSKWEADDIVVDILWKQFRKIVPRKRR